MRSTAATAAASEDATVKHAKVKAASVNAARVKAAFAEAGLSQDAIDRILTQYPSYLRWPVEQKLLPAMQRWQQELGASFHSEVERIPQLLLTEPEEELLKDRYLVSIGISSTKRLRQRNPNTFRRSLASMQGRVAFLQALGFTHAQVSSLVEKHPDILGRSSEHVADELKVVGDIFDCAHDMDTVAEVMLSCRRMGLCTQVPTALHQRFLYFCSCVGVNDKEMARAWKHGVFVIPPAELDIRLASIAAQLGATLDEAKSVVRRHPQIANLQPARVGLHVTQMLTLGFSYRQVKAMCLKQPSLVTLNYNSQLQVEKWAFLIGVLQLSHVAIAAKPHLLMSSFPDRLWPRWKYLQQLRLHGVISFTDAHEVIGSLVDLTDSRFAAKYRAPQICLYYEQFKKQWQNR